jgi:hypothetical protein
MPQKTTDCQSYQTNIRTCCEHTDENGFGCDCRHSHAVCQIEKVVCCLRELLRGITSREYVCHTSHAVVRLYVCRLPTPSPLAHPPFLQLANHSRESDPDRSADRCQFSQFDANRIEGWNYQSDDQAGVKFAISVQYSLFLYNYSLRISLFERDLA